MPPPQLEILLNNVLPTPLAEVHGFHSAVWRQELSLYPQERIYLQAPSGKGKSTLLNLLLGLRRDYTGHIQLGGHALHSLGMGTWARLRREQLAYCPQGLRLLPQISAWENLLLKQRLTGHTAPTQLVAWAERLEVAAVLSQPAHTLSYGQQQRVALLRALAQPFQWLLLDEPFSHLDPQRQLAAAVLIAERLAAEQAGLLLTGLEKELRTELAHALGVTRTVAL